MAENRQSRQVPVECGFGIADFCPYYGRDALLRGIAASPRCVRGHVRIVSRPDEEFEPGSILVTEKATTEYIDMLMVASGYITSRGGMSSHAAAIARGLNKPCVTGTESHGAYATEVLEDGQMVVLDGCHGTVYKM